MSRTLRSLAVLAIIALISAGCSNAPAEAGTGSSGGNKNRATHEQAVKFAECMRDNGVQDFADPNRKWVPHRRGGCSEQAGVLGRGDQGRPP